MKNFKAFLFLLLIIIASVGFFRYILRYFNESKVLKQVIERLEADSRIAEVVVTGVNYNEEDDKLYTTIKFVEYDVSGDPLEPKYFTFSGNIIQFQALVIRFNDVYIKRGDALRQRSAYLFWKVFMLDGHNTQEYEITKIDQIPEGYKIGTQVSSFERKLWKQFWQYALNPKEAENMGVKNAQIEAPGMIFVPGVVYIIKIEHDGGIRIDPFVLPDIMTEALSQSSPR